jgi:hypothetical protein
MVRLLRKINQLRWLDEAPAEVTLAELSSDPVGDFQTDNKSLSVWTVEADRSNLDRVIAAFASNANLRDFEFVVFDPSIVERVGLQFSESEGKTPDQEANIKWHRDIIGFSAMSLIEFTRIIWKEGERDYVPKKKVLELISTSVTAGHIDRSRVNASIREKLDKNPN